MSFLAAKSRHCSLVFDHWFATSKFTNEAWMTDRRMTFPSSVAEASCLKYLISRSTKEWILRRVKHLRCQVTALSMFASLCGTCVYNSGRFESVPETFLNKVCKYSMWICGSPEMLRIFGRPHFEMMDQRWLGGMHSWMVNASTCLMKHLFFYNWTLQESDTSRQEGEGFAANHVI